MPTWENRRHGIRLYRGDCMRVLPAIRCQADFLLADPCYGTTAAAWDVPHDYARLLPRLTELLRPGRCKPGSLAGSSPLPWRTNWADCFAMT